MPPSRRSAAHSNDQDGQPEGNESRNELEFDGDRHTSGKLQLGVVAMIDYREIEKSLCERLDLASRPISMAFLADAPEGVSAFLGSEPSTCSFWRIAAAGKTFYTVPGDHTHCPIGSYTHNVPLPEARRGELDQVLEMMSGIGYPNMNEVPEIPRLSESPGVIVYAPLGDTPVDPDVVLVAARPARLMLLQEAAQHAGVPTKTPTFGRPTCMAVPAALGNGIVTSTGCVGNRVYTDLSENQLYMMLSGPHVVQVVAALSTIETANATLRDYHQERKARLRQSG